ncbi:hypothetical protein [Collimonas sp. OK242]|uniref:hypothetical protein n=1 Tax=Collimonas sp. OK242 TaxID=1798195 RepID=UPI00116003AA|nr:hypothetical protein [Collimonas sp. OK242]
MDIDPKTFPYLNFSELKRIDPNDGRGNPPDKLIPVVQKRNQYPEKKVPGGAENAPQDATA